jgi:hypothetical protein
MERPAPPSTPRFVLRNVCSADAAPPDAALAALD